MNLLDLFSHGTPPLHACHCYCHSHNRMIKIPWLRKLYWRFSNLTSNSFSQTQKEWFTLWKILEKCSDTFNLAFTLTDKNPLSPFWGMGSDSNPIVYLWNLQAHMQTFVDLQTAVFAHLEPLASTLHQSLHVNLHVIPVNAHMQCYWLCYLPALSGRIRLQQQGEL